MAPETFAAALHAARQTPRGAFLSDYSAADLRGARCFLAPDGRAGGCVKRAADGTLEAVSVFSLERGRGAEVLETLERNGATRLDCLGIGLRAYYAARGWAVSERIAWDDAYAPEAWNYRAHGRPDVFVMTRDSLPLEVAA